MTAPLSPPDSSEFSSQDTKFLLESARSGRDAAWRVLYERYERMLIVLVASRMKGKQSRRFDAEDVLQEAFSKAWAKIDTFEYRGEGSLRRWMRRIVIHQFYSLVQRRDSSELRASEEKSAAALADAAARSRSASQVLAEVEEKGDVLAKMVRLSDDDQDLISMRIFEGMEWEEIGKLVGCSRKLASERFDRAIARLTRIVD